MPEKVGGLFGLRGRIFQKWVTNFWTGFFDDFFPWNFRSFVRIWVQKKDPTRNSPPHLGRTGGVYSGLSQYHSRVRGWDTPALDQTACAKSCQQWGGAKLGWVVSFVLTGRWQPFPRKRLQQTECNNIVFCGSLRFCWFKSIVYVGDSFGR